MFMSCSRLNNENQPAYEVNYVFLSSDCKFSINSLQQIIWFGSNPPSHPHATAPV